MKFLAFELPLKALNLYPLGDWHHGSRQAFPRFIKQEIAEIWNDPEARWCSMGDLIENAIVGSKSDVYLATSNPEKQIEDVVELLRPIKDKGLFMIPGNHSARTMRVAGIDPDKVIADLLGIPYARYSILASFGLAQAKARAVCYFHHSRGGGSTPGGKVNAAAKLRRIVPSADAVFCGHSHTTNREPLTWFDAGNKGLIRRKGYNYIIGSALTWKESYAEEKGYMPAAVEQIMVRFEVKSHHDHAKYLKQTYHIIQPD
jgi:hypothetical protein